MDVEIGRAWSARMAWWTVARRYGILCDMESGNERNVSEVADANVTAAEDTPMGYMGGGKPLC